MNEKKPDRRIRYTKMVIKQALFDLMRNNPINKITVTEICELAEINRGTFYTYYTDPYDLMAQIENELYSEINRALENSLVIDTNYELFVEILEYISKNTDLCEILLSKNGDKDFVRRIVNLAHDKSILEWQKAEPDATTEDLELLYIFISNGTVGIIQNWIVNNTKQSPKEVAEFVIELNKRCINSKS
jgi:AcrR family transcriptional regulator